MLRLRLSEAPAQRVYDWLRGAPAGLVALSLVVGGGAGLGALVFRYLILGFTCCRRTAHGCRVATRRQVLGGPGRERLAWAESSTSSWDLLLRVVLTPIRHRAVPDRDVGTVHTAASSLMSSRRSRRAVSTAMVLTLTVFAFEHGVHSVHHLDEPVSSVACAAASTAAQLAGLPVDGASIYCMAVPLLGSCSPDSSSKVDLCSRSAPQGRAPPLAA